MPDDTKSLRRELELISDRIAAIQFQLKACKEKLLRKQLQSNLKHLQWQALFYPEKIENLQAQDL